MSEYIEIMLESIKINKAQDLLDKIISFDNIISIQYLENKKEKFINSAFKQKFQSILDRDYIENDYIKIDVSHINFNSISISLPNIWLYNNNHRLDCLIIFEIEDWKNFIEIIVPIINKNISQLAKNYNIKNYYGGLEPAKDIETRFFTKTKLGPLMP